MKAVWIPSLVVLVAMAVTPASAGDSDVDEASTPQILAVAFTRSGDAASGKLEASFLGKMRTAYATRNVLFVSADLSTPATTHQARLLLNAMGAGEVWAGRTKLVGKVVLLDVEWGSVRATLDANTKTDVAQKAFEAALKPQEDMDDGDDEGDEEDDR
jgi:hypothetical protein